MRRESEKERQRERERERERNERNIMEIEKCTINGNKNIVEAITYSQQI